MSHGRAPAAPGTTPAAVTTPAPGDPSLAPSPADADWDRFVEANPLGSYLQLSAWARVKAANDWTCRRVLVDGPSGPVGAQVLLRRPRPLPWAFAYAPRGPVADAWTPGAVAAFTDAVRAARPALGRVSHLRIDPEVERDGPLDPDGTLRRALVDAGWRPAPKIQPPTTRVVDLRADEAALWADLRKKWRQYVNRARAGGVTVVELPGDPIAPFYRVYRETAARAGFLIRTEQAYRDIWSAFAPAGRASVLFAIDAAGTPQAALFLVRCGSRVVEPYGGMTAEGAELRANYLLKWEGIRRSREAGATTYDMWGLAHPGIAHFKTGFGGREIAYLGAWDLVLDPVGRLVYEKGQAARVRLARARAGLGKGIGSTQGDGPGGHGGDGAADAG